MHLERTPLQGAKINSIVWAVAGQIFSLLVLYSLSLARCCSRFRIAASCALTSEEAPRYLCVIAFDSYLHIRARLSPVLPSFCECLAIRGMFCRSLIRTEETVYSGDRIGLLWRMDKKQQLIAYLRDLHGKLSASAPQGSYVPMSLSKARSKVLDCRS